LDFVTDGFDLPPSNDRTFADFATGTEELPSVFELPPPNDRTFADFASSTSDLHGHFGLDEEEEMEPTSPWSTTGSDILDSYSHPDEPQTPNASFSLESSVSNGAIASLTSSDGKTYYVSSSPDLARPLLDPVLLMLSVFFGLLASLLGTYLLILAMDDPEGAHGSYGVSFIGQVGRWVVGNVAWIERFLARR
jgi:hypothetical protein